MHRGNRELRRPTHQMISPLRGALLLLASLACASALRVQPPLVHRRQALVGGVAAALGAVPLPALAKSKASVNPNKQCNTIKDDYGLETNMCAGANARDDKMKLYAAQKTAMAGDKGTRGTEIQKGYKELEAKRLETNKKGNKPNVNAGRKAPDPTALGLKSYGGAYLGPRL